MVASLVVFVPGAALTTAVLELAAGQMVSGSSRLVSGAMQLALLAFGILAGIEAVGIPSSRVFASSGDVLGDWARWLGVLVFACGVKVANSTPAGSFPGLLIVLYADVDRPARGKRTLRRLRRRTRGRGRDDDCRVARARDSPPPCRRTRVPSRLLASGTRHDATPD